MPPLKTLFGEEAEILGETNFRLLLFATVLPVMGSAMLSPVLGSLIGPFGTTEANIGLVISFFTAPAIVVIPLAGVLADKYGRRTVLAPSLVLFGISGAAVALTTQFRVVLGLRFLQGISFGGINPIIITSIGDAYAGSREATGQGLRFMSSGLSGALSPLIAGLLVVSAWQYPFLLYTLAIPIGLGVFLLFDEPTDADETSGEDRNTGSYRRDLSLLVRRRRVLSLIVARTLPNVVWIAFLTYNSLIVVRLFDGTPPQAGILAGIGSFILAIAASQAGRITALVDSRFYPLVASNVLLGLGFVVVLFAPGLVLATVGTTVLGVGFGVTLSLYRSAITGLAGPSLRAGLVSLTEAGSRLTTTLTPIAMGGVIALVTPQYGFDVAIQLAGAGAAAIASCGGLGCLWIARQSTKTPAERDEGAADAPTDSEQ